MAVTTLPDPILDLRTGAGLDRPSTGVEIVHRAPHPAPVPRALAETARERLDPDALPPAVLADMLGPTPWRRVIVLGDAVESGVGDAVDGYRDVSWVARIVEALRGRDGLSDLDDGAGLAVVSARADDLLTPGLDPSRIHPAIDAGLGALAGRGDLVVTVGPLDVSRIADLPAGRRADLRDRLQVLDEATRRLAARHDGLHVDLFGDAAFGQHMMSADMRHADRRGHAHIAAVVARALVAHWRSGA